MSTRRILLLAEQYPPRHIGGAGVFAATLAKGLVSAGHTVDVVCIDPSLDEETRRGRLRVVRVRTPVVGWSLMAFEDRRRRMVPVMLSFHKQQGYDLIHDVGGFLYNEVFRDFVAHTGIPSITHLQIMMGPYLKAAGAPSYLVDVFHDLQHLQCASSTAVVTISNAEQARYASLFGSAPGVRVMIHNAVSPLRPQIEMTRAWRAIVAQDDAIVLLIASRLRDAVKGYDRAVTLARALKKSGLKVRLVSTNLDTLPTRQRDVINLGRVTGKDFASLLKAVDIVLCPSRYEAFGLLPVEAGTVGTPVLASKLGGHLDTIGPAVTGMFLEDKDWTKPPEAVVRFVASARTAALRKVRRPPQSMLASGMLRSVLDLHDSILGVPA